MKVGDLVKLKAPPGRKDYSCSAGIIVKIFQKKCWRAQERGPHIDWRKIDPEPHAEVMINETVLGFPMSELELV